MKCLKILGTVLLLNDFASITHVLKKHTKTNGKNFFMLEYF